MDGQLQFYNALEDRNITKLQVGPPNPVKDFMNFRIPESIVAHAAFSKSGDWLVTVERRLDGKTPTLKFWSYDTRSQQYESSIGPPLPSLVLIGPCNSPF